MELHGKVAARYARAILEWAGANKAKALAEELKSFGALIGVNPELRVALTTGVFAEEDRKAVLEDLFKKLNLSEEAKRTVLVISEMKRLRSLPAIAAKLTELLLTSENIVPVSVVSSSALGSEEKKQIEARFSKLLGNPVEAAYTVEPKLIGGVRVTAGGKTYDGTISGWLNRVEEILVGGNI